MLAGLLAHTDRAVHIYGETAGLTDCYRENGIAMVPTVAIDDSPGSLRLPLRGELVIAPHSFGHSAWPERLGDHETAFASGWMSGGGRGMRGRYDRGFALSDHADWPGLLKTIEETGARRVLVLHGKDGALIRQLRRRGTDASLFTRESLRKPAPPFQLPLFRIS